MISRITFGEAMRATPPSARIWAGTRSNAITATAPARSAISACFAVVTSMITPPLSISARPVLRRRLVLLCPLFCDIGALSFWNHFTAGWQFRVCRSLGSTRPRDFRGRWLVPNRARLGRARAPVPTRALAIYKSCEHAVRIDGDEQALTARQHFAFFVQDLGHVDMLPRLYFDLARFHPQGPIQRHRLEVVHGNLGSQRHHVTQLIHLAHGFIEDGGMMAPVAVSGQPG